MTEEERKAFDLYAAHVISGTLAAGGSANYPPKKLAEAAAVIALSMVEQRRNTIEAEAQK